MSDVRDWFVMLLVALVWMFSSIILWRHYSDTAFGIWATVCGTLTTVYHWTNVRDDKTKDA